MTYNKDHFRAGDRIYVSDTGGVTNCKGETGTVDQWARGEIYYITLDNGREVVLKANEMQNITGREDKD
jgi:hypothetical protein